MNNFEIAKILKEIAFLLEMEETQFKPRAYEKAARSIEGLGERVDAIYTRGGIKALMEIPGIGKNIAGKIEELITTGNLRYYLELKRNIPVDIENLSRIEGLGPKKIKTLWETLKIKDIEDLEKAAITHKIRELPGFKEKTEQNILKQITFSKRSKERYILGFTLPLIRDIESRLQSLREVKKVTVAGSVRRRRETIGDADFLVVSDNPQRVMDFFISLPEVIDIIGKGVTKSSVKLKTGMDADIRVIPEESYGSTLQYFTGSKDHNIALRKIATEYGWKLSEYGLFQGDIYIEGKTEEGVYNKLGLQWIPPELRENQGEIEAARNNTLPSLIDYTDLKGDLQIHSNWTDGAHSIKEMAEEAEKIGLEYIVISDHSQYLAMTGGLDEKMLIKQGEEIDTLNDQVIGIHILKGVELNILPDGSVDISDRMLESLDVVSAAVHSHFNLGKEEMTKRVATAIENPNVDILCHPTARLLQKREPIQVDMEKIIEKAKVTRTILDIDSFPNRLDLKDEYIRKAVEAGCKLGVSSDSHSKSHLHFLELGIAQARRGWATPKSIINTRNVEELLKMIKD